MVFATAIRWAARKPKPKMKPIELKTPPEQTQTITRTLFDIIREHGPLTIADTWEHVKINSPLKVTLLIWRVSHRRLLTCDKTCILHAGHLYVLLSSWRCRGRFGPLVHCVPFHPRHLGNSKQQNSASGASDTKVSSTSLHVGWNGRSRATPFCGGRSFMAPFGPFGEKEIEEFSRGSQGRKSRYSLLFVQWWARHLCNVGEHTSSFFPLMSN